MILDTCDRTALLAEGTIIHQGETKEVLQDKDLLERYGLELPLCIQGNRDWSQGR